MSSIISLGHVYIVLTPTRATLNRIVATWCTLRNWYAIPECLSSVRHEVPKHVRVQIYHRNRIRHVRAAQARALSICTDKIIVAHVNIHAHNVSHTHTHTHARTHTHSHIQTDMYRHIPEILSRHNVILFLKEDADDNSEFLNKKIWKTTRQHRWLGRSREMV